MRQESNNVQTRPTFEVDLSFLASVVAKKPKESVTFLLNSEMVVSPMSNLEDFICAVCLCVPMEVKQCKQCYKLFDKKCLEKWTVQC